MEQTPFFSVVIPFRNAKRTIDACLDGIRRQSFESCEFIFVDNASNDASPEAVRDFIRRETHLHVSCMLEKKAGASAARNAGARRARGQWLVFTDSDCVVAGNWLVDFRHAIAEDPSCAAFAGCIKPAPEGNTVAKFLGMYTLPANREKKIHWKFELTGGGFPTANFAVRKNIFDAVDGFNEKVLIYGEDYELCSRIYRSGNYITSLTDAVVHHIHREDAKGLFRQSYGFGRSHAYCLRHLVKGALIIELPLLRIARLTPLARLWIDLVQFEKKFYFFMLWNMVFPPSVLLTLLFLAHITRKNYRRGSERGLNLTVPEAAYMTFLLLVKSICLGAGRIAGSLEYRVICI